MRIAYSLPVMLKARHHKEDAGFSLIELVVVIAIIGIIAVVAAPEYAQYASKARVRRAANDLIQNIRLTSAMAQAKNREYIMTFNEGGANSYLMGQDVNDNGSLLDAGDAWDFNGAIPVPVRGIDFDTQYVPSIQFGTGAVTGPDDLDACPACVGIAGETVDINAGLGPPRLEFSPEGGISPTGTVFITHALKNMTYMVRVATMTGRVDLYQWDGDIDNPDPVIVNRCTPPAAPPVRFCGWTEVR